jgi:hypothetical protein
VSSIQRIEPCGGASENFRPDEAISKSMLSILDGRWVFSYVLATNLEHGGQVVTPRR